MKTEKHSSAGAIPFRGYGRALEFIRPYGLRFLPLFGLNFVSTANQVIDDNGGNARVDYHLSDKDSMFGRWSYEKFVQNAPNPLVGGQGTCCLPTPAAAAKQFDLGRKGSVCSDQDSGRGS